MRSRRSRTCGVGGPRARKCRELSKGQRQRVRLAAAIVHDPRILILDEPMTGLDPIGRKAVMDLIRARARAGRAVVFSSHILHEVEAVATYVIVAQQGHGARRGDARAHPRGAERLSPSALEIAGPRPPAARGALIGRDHVTAIEWIGDDVLEGLDAVRAAARDGAARRSSSSSASRSSRSRRRTSRSRCCSAAWSPGGRRERASASSSRTRCGSSSRAAEAIVLVLLVLCCRRRSACIARYFGAPYPDEVVPRDGRRTCSSDSSSRSSRSSTVRASCATRSRTGRRCSS